MKKIFLQSLEGIQEDVLKEVLEEREFQAVKDQALADCCLTGRKEDRGENGYRLCMKNEAIEIGYEKSLGFFRGLGAALKYLEMDKTQVREEKASMEGSCGIMYDCSRNGVLRPEEIRCYIRRQALLGLGRLFLYTEDTYEVEGYPYFGAMRGRYTREEMIKCDEYAGRFGVEMIPCIQTLAHLRTALRWPTMRKFRDNEDILIAEEEETYQLIDAMLRSVSSMYRSRKIHLGMDEAFYLGFGNYRKKHGLISQGELIKRHLDRVMELCGKYGLEPMIWSDMFFVTPGGGDYYGVPETYEWPKEQKPESGIMLVYWDYYSHDPKRYERMAKLHRKLTDRVCFAGGGWIWNGLAPDYAKAMDATRCAFQGMKGTGVVDSMMTLWLDNGAETPMTAGIPMLVYYAGCASGEMWKEEELEAWMKVTAGESWKDILLLDRFDHIPGTGVHNEDFSNPCKGIFYQDPLLGIFDRQYGSSDLEKYYLELAGDLKEAGIRSSHWKNLYAYYETLAGILAEKSTLGARIRNAYQEGDKESLRQIAQEQLPVLAARVDQLKDLRADLWMKEYKPQGYEVLDIRIAGVSARIRSTARRISSWLTGEADRLEELEEERLPYHPEEAVPFCNLWEEIASASNITGV